MIYAVYFFGFVEIIAHIVAMREVYRLMLRMIQNTFDAFIQKCADDIEYRNRFASKIFFFQDMGPSIASFSVISLIINQESAVSLIIVFIIGYNMKEYSRRFKNAFYRKIEERSGKCQREQS
jgi:hypothetical protein